MKILFICTAHNSLSQRLYLALSPLHTVSVEYSLSDNAMREAVRLFEPDLIVCPFLTSRVPLDIYTNYLTLIVHPGPPGDAGPSSLDWILMGDDGSEADANLLPAKDTLSEHGRSHWGLTVLQAEEQFDAGPVWAFEQFPINIDQPGLTKSGLYRGAITRAAIAAVTAAIDRIQAVAFSSSPITPPGTPPMSPCDDTPVSKRHIHPGLIASPRYKELSVTTTEPFLGGITHHRPLLKANQRDFDINRHTATEISRRIRCSDSQPGCLSSVLGQSLYLYGGALEESDWVASAVGAPGSIVAVRDEAVCFLTNDLKGIWITHTRRLKKKTDAMLWPKVPAVTGLKELGILDQSHVAALSRTYPTLDWSKSPTSTQQDIWVEFVTLDATTRVAYLYSDFYNGAMSTSQCSRLIECMEYIISTHTTVSPLSALVMMGGDGYFSNGIHLNVIEAAADPALESWYNINRINDAVHFLLHEFPSRKILTIAGLRGNAAAGGVAFATACDVVVAGADVVLNPAYRALGLYGSEYHSISYNARCGSDVGYHLLHDMLPLSAYDARAINLVDHVLPGHASVLDTRIRNHVKVVVRSMHNNSGGYRPASWKSRADVSISGLARARAQELGEMSLDFWSPRAVRYSSRRAAFVRKTKAASTPLRFAEHRRKVVNGAKMQDEEETDDYDSPAYFATKAAKEAEAALASRLLGGLARLMAGGEVVGGISPAVSAPAVKTEAMVPLITAPVVKAAKENGLAAKTQGIKVAVKEVVDAQGPIFSCYYSA